MQTYKIAVARFPGMGVERWETVGWLIRTIRKMDRDDRIEKVVDVTSPPDTPVPMLRNRAVLDARGATADYLLMIDSDMSPDEPTLAAVPFWDVAWEFMLARRDKESKPSDTYYRDVFSSPVPPATVAAPYCGPSPDQCCYVFEWKSRASGHPNPDFQLGMIPRESAAIRSGIQEVAAMPTGLILYDMRVFDVLPPPWFEYEYKDPPFCSQKASTEDVYQTRNASLLGLPQYCAWQSWAVHLKTERVGKPVLMTRDRVHHSLREAVLRGVDSGDQMIVLPEGPPTVQPSEPSDDEVDAMIDAEHEAVMSEVDRHALLRDGMWVNDSQTEEDDEIDVSRARKVAGRQAWLRTTDSKFQPLPPRDTDAQPPA